MSEKKNYFYCMKKTRKDCQEDIFGKPNCNFCEHKEKCEVKENESANSL